MSFRVLTLLVALFATAPASAASVEVGVGSSFLLGSGTLDLGCGSLVVFGDFDAQSGNVQAQDVSIAPGAVLAGSNGNLNVTGNWDNQGSLIGGQSTVNLIDGCGATSAGVFGSSDFWNLTIVTTTGKTVTFDAGATQTIDGTLTLSGVPGSILVLRSTVGASEAFLNVTAGPVVGDFVDVADVHATGLAIVLGPHTILGPNTANITFRPCGDIDGDLVVGEPDATQARLHLVGLGPIADIAYCNVIGPPDPARMGADCELDDIFLIQRFVAGFGVLADACTP